ncbi:MAG: ATP-binding protein [Pseudomonadota bacterium]
MNADLSRHLQGTARALASLAGVLALIALAGYALWAFGWVPVRPGAQGVPPVTAIALLALAIAVAAGTWRRPRLAAVCAWCGLALGAAVLAGYAARRQDLLGAFVSGRLLGLPVEATGTTAGATAVALVLVAGALLLRRRRAPLADLCGGLALVLAGTVLLGYIYGVDDLYALPLFNDMALRTAVGLFVLALAALLVEPRLGWSSVIATSYLGGGATRRQMAFTLVPPIAGWLLLKATDADRLGYGAAMALLVMTTVVPLALMVLRDGRVQIALDAERRAKAALQADLTRDMAERLERQATQLAHESAERAQAEAAMYGAQRMEAVGQLTGGIAHDFNNLLMTISGNLQLLRRRLPDDHPGRRHALNAIAAVDKGSKLTAQLLAFSRSQRLDIRPMAMQAVMTGARTLIGHALGPAIHVSTDLRSGDAWALGDPDQLELAILNLAVNARDAMPQGGTLLIETALLTTRLGTDAVSTHCVAIRVIDSGCGMPPEVASRAIEPFFTTKERGKGTGLGLAQVYGFVRQCQGDLHIVSQPGVGTTVEILLRRTAPAAVPEPVAPPAEAPSPAGVAERQPLLVVDDDDGVRAVIADAMDAAGYDVVQAHDGPSGLRQLEHVTPVAAVIDFLMPGMNGAEVARRMQARQPGLPIVFVSGYSDTVALDGIAGAVVLRKPFDVDGLQRAVAAALA